MIPALRWIALGAAVAALSFTHLQAYRQGVAREAARAEAARQALQAELFDLADRASEDAAELAQLRALQDTQLMRFEDEARRDPDAGLRRAP